MTPLIHLFRMGFFAGCGVAASLVFLKISMALILPSETLHEKLPELLSGILFVSFISPHHIEINISLNSAEMWLTFGILVIANGIIYSMAIPTAYIINVFCVRKLKRAIAFFSKSKESSNNFLASLSGRRTKGLLKVSSLGFTAGLIIAITVKAVVVFAIFFQPNYIMSSWLEDIVIFCYPAHFFTVAITKYDFSAVIFICVLILINGIRYSILFFLFGAAWKFVCRHFGWMWR